MSTYRPPPPEVRARRAHQEWLGFVQPVGLVVSIPALERAQCQVSKDVPQKALLALATPADEPVRVPDLPALLQDVLRWSPSDFGPPEERWSVALPDYGEVLRPNLCIFDAAAPGGVLGLITTLPDGVGFDEKATGPGWEATHQARFERLLRECQVPFGLLYNQRSLRLVYAPRGESSGHLTFDVKAMTTVAGRPILAGLDALLGVERMFSLADDQRLPAILEASRRYQNEVSSQLAEQVLGALHALVTGFHAADRATDGKLLAESLREAPNEVYGGLLTTLLRLIFILYAEDRDLLSKDPLYAQHYSVASLFEKLREDAARYPDSMDQRYGAWARLLSLFRMIHDGVHHGPMGLPPRYGRLFDPDAYPFLEGRPRGDHRQLGARLSPPRVSDGVVFRVLEALLILSGDRLSYRTLDVEHIGSVYEAMMGFSLEVTKEPSLALKGPRKKGAPSADPIVGLETLLAKKGAARIEHLKAMDVDVSGKSAGEVKEAKSIDELAAAFGKKVSSVLPHVLPAGSLVLQPTEERRRSGSHYTPRALTEPIVEKTLAPVLAGLGERPTPEQILSLKICDPAMGSGAFLVAACRALGSALEAAWHHHGTPPIPPDEDQVLYARRLVAQRCLYGVDKNPFAVDLAKLSLWLVTLAKNHPFTFLDHALRCGDSLVGLSLEQLMAFHWAPEAQQPTIAAAVRPALAKAERLRAEIQRLADSGDTRKKRALLDAADETTAGLRQVADAALEAFFSEAKDKDRRRRLGELSREVSGALSGEGARLDLETAEGLRPFHWPLEFPEVFHRERPGFDAFVGNPPFAGKNTLLQGHGEGYLDWLKTLHEGAHGNADLVAHFFRRVFVLLRDGGAFGLIATNTIAQGDTRATGLYPIVKAGGVIYDATRRKKWPTAAAVIVSVVHVAKALKVRVGPRLDDREVPRISAFLFHTGPDEDPKVLAANANQSFQGSIVLGMGFTFDDSNPEATPIAEMERLIAKDPRNRERIFPYLGGEELNTSPTHAHHRFVINFGQMSEEEARQWPDLMAIVEAKVKRERLVQKDPGAKKLWWQFIRTRPELYEAIRNVDRVLAIARTTKHLGFAQISPETVFSENLVLFAAGRAAFSNLQSRAHDIWVRFTSSTLEDRLGYRPSDCFETFPFPKDWATNSTLEAAGQAYYDFRAALMVQNDQGLTATYNRFHDPDENDPGILKLRALHDAMDRAVLDAYGWTDVKPTCTFLLDYEEDDDQDEDTGKKRRKKPWRYRWPDDTRDEVLARLLALNNERAAAEALLGQEAHLKSPAKPKKPKKPKKTKKTEAAAPGTPDLFNPDDT
ncbi:MAG: N-6 DNA methylase [Deltaproteobacteria bacterium]|nr:N-6 DNA methylase [Deltaproteobacteria bacterium]